MSTEPPTQPPQDISIYHRADEYIRVFRTAVRKALAENRRKGIPNVYQVAGRWMVELPNGELRPREEFASLNDCH